MSRFYISMGSNMGNSLEIFRKAFIRISEIPGLSLVKASSIYNTKPWGKTDQPDFLNAVLLITSGCGTGIWQEEDYSLGPPYTGSGYSVRREYNLP